MNRLLKSFFGLTLGVAFSLGVAASLNANKKAIVKETEAASTNRSIELRFTRPSDWGSHAVHLHTWDNSGGTTWPGHTMDYLWDNEYGQAVYSWSPNSNDKLYSNIVFNNGGNGMQTDDLSSPSTSTAYWYDNGWQTGSVGSMDVYLYDYDNLYNGTVNVYTWRDGTNYESSSYPGQAAAVDSIATNGLIYKFTINNCCNRVIFSGANEAHKTQLDSGMSGNYCYVKASDSTSLDGKNSWWNNINYVHAHNFAQNTMMFRSISTSDQSSTAYCATRYAAAKTHMEAITSSGIGDYIINEIENNFTDALPRLAAWAKANGKTFDTSSHTFSSAHNFSMLSVSDNNGFIVVVSISALGILSVGAYYFFKKSKKAEE